MMLNYDLIRTLLLNIEEVSAPNDALWEPNLENALTDPVIYEHMDFLKDVKLIKGSVFSSSYDHSFIYRGIVLTAKGYDFVNSCRSNHAWAMAKEKIASQPGVSFDTFFEWMKSQANADFLAANNCKHPRCSRCGRIHFETMHMKLDSAGFGVLSICCSSCGAVAGIIDTKLHDKLNEAKPL